MPVTKRSVPSSDRRDLFAVYDLERRMDLAEDAAYMLADKMKSAASWASDLVDALAKHDEKIDETNRWLEKLAEAVQSIVDKHT